MKTNEEILENRVALYNQRSGARVGDYLQLPHGELTRFTHDWGDSIQTGGSDGGSYYIGNGYLSYSGGLDSGVQKKDIRKTNKTKSGSVWFFDGDVSGANRGVYFNVEFRIFKLKKDADLSGLPQIKRHEKELVLKKVESLTLINGNDNEYSVKLPEIIMVGYTNDGALDLIFRNTGLRFEKYSSGYICQPRKSEQIVKLLLTYNFETHYFNNSCNRNQMFLYSPKDRHKP